MAANAGGLVDGALPADSETELLQNGSSVTPKIEQWRLPMGLFLNTSFTFKHLVAAKERLSEQTPSPAMIHLREGISLPFVGEVKWDLLKQDAKAWLRNPKNLALLAWISAVAISGAILFMVMVGMLNSVLPKESDRNTWFEVNNQILNALFTLMCLYVHPARVLHLWMLCRWNSSDIIVLRKIYCKNGTRKPHEWAHMLVVVVLLHLNCFCQYALCGLNWGFKRSVRPPIGVAVCLSGAIGFAAAAGIYNIVSPLGRDFVEEDLDDTTQALNESEKGQISTTKVISDETKRKYWLLERKVSFASREGNQVQSPEWQGGLFGFTAHPGSAFLSAICCFCVFGWNMDRLGFGNRFVHIATFLLLCSAPSFVLNLAAVNIGNEAVRHGMGGGGIALSIFGLMYGGYWRIKMRKTFNLPAQRWCCNEPNMTDCTQWLFCSVCSLCQEVRTAHYYDVKDEKFYLRQSFRACGANKGDSPRSSPLGREASDASPIPLSSVHSLPTTLTSDFSAPQSASSQSKVIVEGSEFLKHEERERAMSAPEPIRIELARSATSSQLEEAQGPLASGHE